MGDDFGEGEYAILHDRGVNTDDIEHVAGGKTFFWAGRYHRDINQRDTLQTDLNVFQDFEPKLSEASRAADVIFLANIQPDLQREVREQCTRARFVAMDSMNFWIESAHGSLLQTISLADCLVLNDGELEQLTDEPNLTRAARKALELGPALRDRQAGRVRLRPLHARGRLLRHHGLPDGRHRRADGRRRHVRGRPDGLPRRPRGRDRRRRRCAARWPTARPAPRSTSRASAASGSTRSTAPRSTPGSPSSRQMTRF